MTGKGRQGPVVIERHGRMKKKFAQVSSDIKRCATLHLQRCKQPKSSCDIHAHFSFNHLRKLPMYAGVEQRSVRRYRGFGHKNVLQKRSLQANQCVKRRVGRGTGHLKHDCGCVYLTVAAKNGACRGHVIAAGRK
jgi:hypothetical protein